MSVVRVQCPATSANLGPGFDALGIALGLQNTFFVEPAETFEVVARGPGADEIPSSAQNLTVVAFQATREALGLPPVSGLRVEVEIAVPPSRGLGSSATATVAGILAAERLAGATLDERARVELASRLEGHPDNTTPCLLGGLCVATSSPEGAITYLRAELPSPPAFVVAIPEGLRLSTADMRAVLPERVPFADAVTTAGAAALLVFALLQGKPGALGAALRDRLHEPYRGPKIPGFEQVREAAREAGALGTVISGSGPTLLSLVDDAARESAVIEAMQAAWRAAGVTSQVRTLPMDTTGAASFGG